MPQIGFAGWAGKGLPMRAALADAGYQVIATGQPAGLKETTQASGAAGGTRQPRQPQQRAFLITMSPGPATCMRRCCARPAPPGTWQPG